MTLLAGWFDAAGTPEPARVLAAMAAERHDIAVEAERAEATPHFGLVVQGFGAETHFGRDGDLWLGLAGDPFWREPTLAALATERGHAAALAEAYRCHGDALVEQLGGAFTIVVADMARRAGFAAIDRAGIGRLCWASPRPGTIVFASSADAVRRHPSVTTGIADQAIYDFLSFYAVPCPTTIYQGVRKLVPAQALPLGPDDPVPRFYWRMPYDQPSSDGVDALAGELRTVLDRATARACGAERPERLGTFLSGGLDSSSVTGLLAARTSGRARSFTIGFAEPGFDERAYARMAAERFATDHHEHVLTPEDAAALLPRLAAAYDEPFANTSAIPAFYCARQARGAGVAVMLAGDGGDELFAGNSRYLDMLRMERYQRLPRWLRRGLIEPVSAALPLGDRLPLVGKLRGRVRRYALPLPERMHYGLLESTAHVEDFLAPDFLATVDRHHPATIMREVYQRTPSSNPLQRMLHHDLQLTLADNDLRKVERMAAVAGVRVRYPMLDDDVMEFSARVPPALLLAGGRLRDFYKHAMAGFLPEGILTKQKHGFGMPFGPWMASGNGFRSFCLDLFAGFARRRVLNPAFAASVSAALVGPDPAGAPVGFAIDVALLESWLATRGY